MEILTYYISQSGSIIKVAIVVIAIALFFFIRRARSNMYKPSFDDSDMPANIWFYSKLTDIEIGSIKPNYQNLFNAFMQFLCRKYFIYKVIPKPQPVTKVADGGEATKSDPNQPIFDIVSQKEDNPQILELYGEIYNSIDDLKQSPASEVIAYIKEIKPLFNKEDLSEWIATQQKQKDEKCNNC